MLCPDELVQGAILEMHSLPGGLCTARTREGYTFDIVLTGSKPEAFHEMRREPGVMEDRRLVYYTKMSRVESGNRRLSISTDRQRAVPKVRRRVTIQVPGGRRSG